MARRWVFPAAAASAAAMLAACGPQGAPEREKEPANAVQPETDTVNIPQSVSELAPGTTPMAQRTAVIGVLNKRNVISRDLTLRPGQSVRVGDIIVRLRACETTAPWEEQRLTGAFIQVDARNPQGQYQRIFSGWVYKESPSLNVVEHPVYDVWVKSCAMTHPEAGASTVRAGSAESNRSNAPNSPASSGGTAARAPERPASPKASESATR